MRRLLFILLLLVAAATPASGQPTRVDTFPGKVRIASTAADALCVGSTGVSPASSSCTGGIYAGPIVATAITITGFGTNLFSAGGTGANQVRVRNTTAGTGNFAGFGIQADSGATDGGFHYFSTTYTSAGDIVANGARLYSAGPGGLSIAAEHASGVIRFYSGGTTETASITGAGSAQLAMDGGAYGSGTSGAVVNVGQNTTGSGAPGLFCVTNKIGGVGCLWSDSTGVLRIAAGGGTPTPTSGDTVGTIVGTQTSTLESKQLIAPFTDTKRALDVVAGAPLWRFTYKGGAYNGSEFVGIISNTTPEVMMDPSPEHPEGRSFSPVSAFGYTAAAIAELRKQIERLQNPFLVSFGAVAR